jgi:sugar fermentation stimulation protein A
LHKGKLIKRYKRFLADVELPSGEIVTAHCPNTGSMESCYEVGATVWLTHNDSPTRKLKWTWEFTEIKEGLIGVNTSRPNELVGEALASGTVPSIPKYNSVRREVKYGKNSRIDALLEQEGKKSIYVEVKNTTLRRGDGILFPDAVTERGRKHLEELMEVVKAGHRAVMLFLVNRPDGKYFAPADDIDPKYGEVLRVAHKAGVEIIAIRSKSTTHEMEIGELVPIKI